MPRPRFIRSDTMRHSRLGKGRPKLQKWRRPRGRHSKIRRKRFGYPATPTVGHKTRTSDVNKVRGLLPILVHNVQELQNLSKTNIVIIARVGARNKLEIVKKAESLGLQIANRGGKR